MSVTSSSSSRKEEFEENEFFLERLREALTDDDDDDDDNNRVHTKTKGDGRSLNRAKEIWAICTDLKEEENVMEAVVQVKTTREVENIVRAVRGVQETSGPERRRDGIGRRVRGVLWWSCFGRVAFENDVDG